MKTILLLVLIFVANATYAQKDAKATHPKVSEYSQLVNNYLPYKKSGKAEQARLSDMSQKALEDLAKVEQKEKEVEKATLEKVSKDIKTQKKKTKVRSQRYQNIKKNIS